MNPNTMHTQADLLIRRLQAMPESNRHETLMQYISGLIRDIVDLDATEWFAPTQRLFELGLQSRNIIELKDRLEFAFSIRLPVTLFFQHSTLELLTTNLLTEALGLAPRSQTPCMPTSPNSQKHDLPLDLEELQQLSEADAETRVLEKIAEVEKRMAP